MTMRRRFTIIVLAAVLIAAVAVVGFAVRRHDGRRFAAAGTQPTKSVPMTSMGKPTDQPAQGVTQRGEVTIDPRRQQLIGVRTVAVERKPLERTIRAVGLVRYDETRQADVNLKVEGWIRDLYVDSTGQPVRKGQPLFTLYSSELLTTENEYLLALKTRDQLQQSMIADARQRADDLAAAARQRLVLWDLPEAAIHELEKTRRADDAVVFRAPVSGFVIEKTAIKGMHVIPGQTLYKVANLDVVWVEADVYETELKGLRVGAAAAVTVNAYPGDRFKGRVVYIYPYLDEQTRTNRVRFEFANPGGRLKPGMYATTELRSGSGTGLTVPINAVLDSGTEQVVFVAEGDGRFEPRKVKIGGRLGDAIEIIDGLTEGEQVATGATFFLDSESQLKASLQAYEPLPSSERPTPSIAAVDIALRTIPDPPKTGDTQFEAVVKDASGKPVEDADVTVQLFMAAMPTMNMPAMRSQTKLSPAGGGTYRGTGRVPTAGRWDVTVSVTRKGKELGNKTSTLTAK